MIRATSAPPFRSLRLAGYLLGAAALGIPLLHASEGNGSPGGGNGADYACEDATNWPTPLSKTKDFIYTKPDDDTPEGEATGAATVSMLFIKGEYEETCGDDNVAGRDATCKVKWKVKLGATAVTGRFNEMELSIYKDGVAVTTGASAQALDDSPKTTDWFTVDQACGAHVDTTFDVRPDPGSRPFTDAAVDDEGVWTYPLNHELKVACKRCDTDGQQTGGGDQLNAPGL